MVNLMSVVIAGIMFVVLAFALSIGQTILQQQLSTQTANTYAYNATVQGQQAINTLSQWQNTMALVIAAAFVIGILVAYMLGSVYSKRGGM